MEDRFKEKYGIRAKEIWDFLMGVFSVVVEEDYDYRSLKWEAILLNVMSDYREEATALLGIFSRLDPQKAIDLYLLRSRITEEQLIDDFKTMNESLLDGTLKMDKRTFKLADFMIIMLAADDDEKDDE